MTKEALACLDEKVKDHRKMFRIVFPDEKLKPKHHFMEYYQRKSVVLVFYQDVGQQNLRPSITNSSKLCSAAKF